MRFKRLLREYTLRRSVRKPGDTVKVSEFEVMLGCIGLRMEYQLSNITWDVSDTITFLRKGGFFG